MFEFLRISRTIDADILLSGSFFNLRRVFKKIPNVIIRVFIIFTFLFMAYTEINIICLFDFNDKVN